MITKRSWSSAAAIAVAVILASATTPLGAQPTTADAVRIGDNDLGGVVTGASGPEAGVWVIAETTDLPTKFARIVVTDDLGRYVLPDLPRANYQVFVRASGLVDSGRQAAKPGQQLNLRAEVALDAKTAAQVYPAAWWFAMLSLPE